MKKEIQLYCITSAIAMLLTHAELIKLICLNGDSMILEHKS
jgi:hypothetical protein